MEVIAMHNDVSNNAGVRWFGRVSAQVSLGYLKGHFKVSEVPDALGGTMTMANEQSNKMCVGSHSTKWA